MRAYACHRARAPAPSLRSRYSGRLEDYVPAAGLRWLVQGSPAKLAESQSFRPGLDLLFTPERLRATAQTTGFALDTLARGVIAGFDLGTLYLAELPAATAARPEPALRRVRSTSRPSAAPIPTSSCSAGSAKACRSDSSPSTIESSAYAVGDPLLCRVVEAYARGKLKAKRAFEGACPRRARRRKQGRAAGGLPSPGRFRSVGKMAAGGLLSIATALSRQAHSQRQLGAPRWSSRFTATSQAVTLRSDSDLPTCR